MQNKTLLGVSFFWGGGSDPPAVIVIFEIILQDLCDKQI